MQLNFYWNMQFLFVNALEYCLDEEKVLIELEA